MLELVKFVGGISWVIGILFLFAVPPIGFLILLVALLCTIYATSKTREKRHAELLAASSSQTTAPAQPASTPQPSVASRLDELEKLKEAGTLTDEEYQEKRRQILDSL